MPTLARTSVWTKAAPVLVTLLTGTGTLAIAGAMNTVKHIAMQILQVTSQTGAPTLAHATVTEITSLVPVLPLTKTLTTAVAGATETM